ALPPVRAPVSDGAGERVRDAGVRRLSLPARRARRFLRRLAALHGRRLGGGRVHRLRQRRRLLPLALGPRSRARDSGDGVPRAEPVHGRGARCAAARGVRHAARDARPRLRRARAVARAPRRAGIGSGAMEPLVAYLHYLAIVIMAGFLVAEMVVCRPTLGAEHVRLLPRLGILFFAGALPPLPTRPPPPLYSA